jgi:hypothetical protein
MDKIDMIKNMLIQKISPTTGPDKDMEQEGYNMLLEV